MTKSLNKNAFNAVVADKPTLKMIYALKKIRLIKKRLEQKEKQLKDAILYECEDNEAICTSGGVILATCKKTITNRFDTESFKESYRELYLRYLKKTESRTLLIKE